MRRCSDLRDHELPDGDVMSGWSAGLSRQLLSAVAVLPWEHGGMRIDAMILLPVAALVSSVLLLLAGRKRIFELLAVIASGAWLALHMGIFKWPLTGISQGLVLGGTLLAMGVIVYLKVKNKREVTASTVVAILGGILVVGSIGSLG